MIHFLCINLDQPLLLPSRCFYAYGPYAYITSFSNTRWSLDTLLISLFASLTDPRHKTQATENQRYFNNALFYYQSIRLISCFLPVLTSRVCLTLYSFPARPLDALVSCVCRTPGMLNLNFLTVVILYIVPPHLSHSIGNTHIWLLSCTFSHHN